jgi:hypothetical protein
MRWRCCWENDEITGYSSDFLQISIKIFTGINGIYATEVNFDAFEEVISAIINHN